MTTVENQQRSRTLVFSLSASPDNSRGRRDAADLLLSALLPYCPATLLAIDATSVEAGVVSAGIEQATLHYDSGRGLVGVLEALAETASGRPERLGEEILIVSDGLLGPLSDLNGLFESLDGPGTPIRLLNKPDPTFSGEQGTEALTLEPLLIQVNREALLSEGFLSAVSKASDIHDLLTRAGKVGFDTSWVYENSDDDYLLRSPSSRVPLIPWAVFVSDPLLLERWAVSARDVYERVALSGYPLGVFWDYLTHAVPPQVWYTNLALLDIPSGARDGREPNTLATAVCAHVFYPDMFAEMLRYAANVPSPVSLFVTTDTTDKKTELEALIQSNDDAAYFDAIEVRTVSTNDGRDISAFLVDCGDVIQSPRFDLIVKMHSKRSVQDPQSVSSWFRSHLFENLFASPSHVAHIYDRFADEPQLGMVFPPVIHMGLPTMGNGWTANRLPAEALKNRLGIDIPFDTNTPLSPYGSMFIARREALLPLVNAAFRPDEFPAGGNYRDGSLAHVLERLYSYVIYSQGLFSRCVQTPALAEISAVTLEYKLDSISSFLHPHVLEQVKMLGASETGAPSAASIRSLVQRRISDRFPRLGATLTTGWMAGKSAGAAVTSRVASIRGTRNS